MNTQTIKKFRAWDDLGKKMYSPEEIANISNLLWENTLDGKLELNLLTNVYGDRRRMEIMQWTGALDKNNKEIYEGDIILVEYIRNSSVEISYTGVVEFGNCCISYTSESPQHSTIGFYLRTNIPDEEQVGLIPDHNLIDGSAELTILGNIFENPELIK